MIDLSFNLKAEKAIEIYGEVKKRFNLDLDKTNREFFSHEVKEDGTELTFKAVLISKDEYDRLLNNDALVHQLKMAYDSIKTNES